MVPFSSHLTILCTDSVYTRQGRCYIICDKNFKAFWDKLSTGSLYCSWVGRQQLFHYFENSFLKNPTSSSLKQRKGEYNYKELQQKKRNIKYSFKLNLQKKSSSFCLSELPGKSQLSTKRDQWGGTLGKRKALRGLEHTDIMSIIRYTFV